jgi:hypothetical protein
MIRIHTKTLTAAGLLDKARAVATSTDGPWWTFDPLCPDVRALRAMLPRPERRVSLELSPDGQARRDARAGICGECEHAKAVHERTVSCRQCGCGGLSLTRPTSECPVNRW